MNDLDAGKLVHTLCLSKTLSSSDISLLCWELKAEQLI